MTSLDQSKHEPLARACAELVVDLVKECAGGWILISTPLEPGNEAREFDGRRYDLLSPLEYCRNKNLAGRVLDAVAKKVYCLAGAPEAGALDLALSYFEEEAWRDTPQALWDIMEAAGRVGA